MAVKTLYFALVALLALSACAPSRRLCERNYGTCGVVERDTLIEQRLRIDSATVYLTVPVRDTAYVHTADTITVRDESGRVELRKWYDARINAYRIACEAKARDTVVRTVVRHQAPIRVPAPRGGLAWWAWAAMGAGAALALRSLFK